MPNPANRIAHTADAVASLLRRIGADPGFTAEERQQATALADLLRAEQARRDAERFAGANQ